MSRSPNPSSLLLKSTLLITSTLTVMSGATIAPALPAMLDHFASLENIDYWVKLVLTIPALFIVIGAPIVGVIVDRWGRKPVLIASTFLYGFAGGSGLVLNSLFYILAGRAFLGLAVAGVMTSVTALIADYYVGQARANFMGLQAGFMAFGGVIFLSLGGFLADLSWRDPFLIYLLAWLLLPFILLSLFEPKQTNLLSAKNQANEPISKAVLPIRLLLLIYGIALLMQIIFYLIPVQLPFYLQALTQANGTQSGLAIAFCTLFSAFASLFYGRVKARLNFVSIVTLAFSLMGIGYAVIGLADNYSQVLFGLAISGLGLGLKLPNLSVWLTAQVPEILRGRALGGLITFFFLGQFFSPIASQPVVEQVGLANTYTLAGVFLLLLALILIGIGQWKKTIQKVP